MNTTELMNIAVELSGLDKMPEDTGIMVPGENIKKVLMGIDMETAELLLAKELGYDCVVSHHPKNTDANTLDVLNDHIEKLAALGVPRNKSQKMLSGKKDSLSYGRHAANSARFESAAKLMNMPYMCIHTPADLIGEATVQQFLDDRFLDKPNTILEDIVAALEEMHEYKNAVRKPVIRVGSKDSYAGKIYVLMSGLTGPGKDVLNAYFDAGVGTLILMHIPEEDAKAIKKENIGNIIVAGHMSSDSIGLNKIAEAWEKAGVEVTVMSGIIR